MRGGSGEGGSGEDEGLGSETRLDRPHSARRHRHTERGGSGKVRNKGEDVEEGGNTKKTYSGDAPLENPSSQESPSPPPTVSKPAPPAQPPSAGIR